MPDVTLSTPIVQQLTVNFEPGPRKSTRGLFVHDTTGPKDQEQDYRATVGYFDAPGTPGSSQIVIGPTETARVVHDDDISWHGQENNYTHVGAELADDDNHTLPYTDYQYQTLGEYAARASQQYGFPLVRVFSQFEPGLIGHEDSEQGKRWGKRDPGPNFDWGRFIGIAQQVAGVSLQHPHPAFAFNIGPGFDAFLTAHPEYGLPRSDAFSDPYGNTMVWTTGTAQFPKGTLLVWRKWLNEVKPITW